MSRVTVIARHAFEQSRERRRQEAARWFVLLQHTEQLSQRVLESWEKWESVPANREVFDAIERLWEMADAMPPLPAASAAERAADHYDGAVPISIVAVDARAAGSTVLPTRRRFVMRVFGVAAATAAVAFGLQWKSSEYFEVASDRGRSVVFETGLAEHKELVWEDGTRIHLGAQSSVTATYTEQARSVVLDRGEALFNVTRDPQRPFHVNAGAGIITAVGTSFHIRRRQDEVVVTVTEGIVEVTPNATAAVRQEVDPERDKSPSVQRLVRGQEITYDARGKISPVRAAEADTSAAWRDGRFKYHGEPLNHVIQDVNRYSTRQLILSDPAAGNLLYSGTVFQRDIDDWVAGLERIYPEIEVVMTDDGRVLIRTRATAAKITP